MTGAGVQGHGPQGHGITSSTVDVAAVRRRWRHPVPPLLLMGAVSLSIHLATNGLDGFHTDELYYIESGRHPALGYVDCPPVTPMLARLNTSILGVPYSISNLEQGAPILVCTNLRESIDVAWRTLRNFS